MHTHPSTHINICITLAAVLACQLVRQLALLTRVYLQRHSISNDTSSHTQCAHAQEMASLLCVFSPSAVVLRPDFSRITAHFLQLRVCWCAQQSLTVSDYVHDRKALRTTCKHGALLRHRSCACWKIVAGLKNFNVLVRGASQGPPALASTSCRHVRTAKDSSSAGLQCMFFRCCLSR
jgi:hypothetical protein